jgi:hypothetical protein
MSKQKYTPTTAVEQLRRCGVRVDGNVILIGRGPNTPGLRALGAIDYLRKHAGFVVERA